MKKKLALLLVLFLFPVNVFAYSKYIIPGGENIGIEIKYDGVLVIGYYEINNKINDDEIKIGDYIIEVNDNKVSSINELIKEIEENKINEEVNVTIRRKEKIIKTKLKLIDNKTGLYVKDSISGIGTISYIDPETKIYGALGHEIIESKTKDIIRVKSGLIYESNVSSIDKSSRNNPGSKNAYIDKNNKKGTITKNTNHGIFGSFNEINESELIEVGNKDDLTIGNATILTVTENKSIKEYKIKINKIDKKHTTKNIHFEVIDEELLKECGGIVQGMSGSPIIQNNKIYGAVTHVVIENPKKGYGVFITTMLEEGEKQE